MKFKWIVWFIVLVAVGYPSCLLGYTWFCVARVGLPGGGNGPLDAYRHTLASALLAHTLDPEAVSLVTTMVEKSGTAANKMDQHNNQIGAAIGAKAHALRDIEPLVRNQVMLGKINASDAQQSSWLPPETWKERWLC